MEVISYTIPITSEDDENGNIDAVGVCCRVIHGAKQSNSVAEIVQGRLCPGGIEYQVFQRLYQQGCLKINAIYLAVDFSLAIDDRGLYQVFKALG